MDQRQQTRGNFVAFMNRDKQAGDNKPAFDGRIAKPGADDEQRCALWSFEYTDKATGEVLMGFNGRADGINTKAEAIDQITALLGAKSTAEVIELAGNLKLAPHQIVLFTNKKKAEGAGKDRPNFYGVYNPGDGSPVVSISAWARKDRNQHAMLSGGTQYPIPGKSIADQQDMDAEVERMVESGEISRGMPKAKKEGRGGRG